jgi:metallo-beta-lactamase class B
MSLNTFYKSQNIRLGAVALAIGLVAGSASAQTPAPVPVATPYKIIDNTYSVGTPTVSVYLIETSKGLILLDASYAEDAPLIEKNIRALGFKLKDIKILLENHAHRDHVGGLAQLKADTGATMISSVGDRYALEKGVFPGSESDLHTRFPPVKVDRVVKDGETIELGGLTLTAHITPGHTQGSTSWSWPVKDIDGTTHTVLDFCGATVSRNSLVPEQYPGIVADYRHTFATAKNLPGDVFLAPHSEFYGPEAKRAKLGDPGPNPFIDRAGFEALVDYQHGLFETELAKQQKAAAK